MKIKKQRLEIRFLDLKATVSVYCSRDKVEKRFDKDTANGINEALKSIGEGWKGVSLNKEINGTNILIKIV
jgi:hypothetical protein